MIRQIPKEKKLIAICLEKLLYDFYNSSTIDEIANEILGIEPGDERIPVEDHEARKAIIMKHIKKYLEGIS